MHKVELLSPAGSLEKIKWAVSYGADAIYIGGDEFSLRANAANFSLEQIKEAVNYCHQHQVKLYVAINIVFHDSDIQGLDKYLKALANLGVDALIMSDVYAIKRARSIIPNIEVHVSTQASIMNVEAAKYYESLGVTRIVLARECPKTTIKAILDQTNLEVEVFVHGAMCSAISGRCTLSNTITNRDANHGGCSQVCRFDFDLYGDNKNITSEFPFALAAKDLMMAEYIKSLIDMGVHSLKIEGRMRSLYYIAVVTNAYRYLIDNQSNLELYTTRLKRCANRDAVPQFFNQKPGMEASYYNGREEISNQDFIGIVLDYKDNYITLEERNAFSVGTEITIFGPNLLPFNMIIEELLDEDNNPISRANHPHQIVKIKCLQPVSKGDLIHVSFA